jgi:hypothetical protein
MDSVSHAPRSALGGAIAAPLAASAAGARARSRPSPYVLLAAGALLLAAVSLPLHAAPAYDPWAWIIWGREIVHGGLITTGGPTWKPLPVLFTTLFAPFGAAAPYLWLVVARAGGIMAVGLAGLMAWRLTRRGGRSMWPAVSAAGVAGCALLTLYGYFESAAQGDSEGLLLAFVLLVILRHLDGARRQALGFWVGAALLRPEAWPFLIIYGAYSWRRDRVLVASALLAVAALWFLPELWGSGSLLRGVDWARYPRAGSPALAHCPFCAEFRESAWPLLTMPLKVGVLLALAAAARGPLRAHRGAVAALALLGVGWIVEEALLTQVGFSGSDRYLLAPLGILIVLGAVGWGSALRRPPTAAAALALTGVLSLVSPGRGPHLGGAIDVLRAQARVQGDLRAAVQRAGGAQRLLACGSIQTNPSEAPLAAWTLGVPMRRTESWRGDVVIESPSGASAAVAPASAGSPHRPVSRAGAVTVLENCS